MIPAQILVTRRKCFCAERNTLRSWSHSRSRRWPSVGFRDKCCRFFANGCGGIQWLERVLHRGFGMYWLWFSIAPTPDFGPQPEGRPRLRPLRLSKPDLQECPILHRFTPVTESSIIECFSFQAFASSPALREWARWVIH